MAKNQIFLRDIDHNIDGTSLISPVEFNLDADAGKNIMVEYFYFVDAGGNQVDQTAGTVTIEFSAGADIYNAISNGSFDAADARLSTRPKPNAYGTAEKVKFTFAGLVGPATGFKCLITQAC